MSTLMDDLKETTRPMHDSAEGSAFQGLLACGKLSQNAYVQYIGQLYLIHASLEKEIQKHQKNGHNMFSAVSEKQWQEPFLRTDLKHFGVAVESLKANKATATLIDHIQAASAKSPVGLLGFHYVLLGSKHGGKMVAKCTRDVFKLPEAEGALYFDPYGANFMPIWMKFKEDMNQLPVTADDRQAICRGAQDTFKGIGAVGDELMVHAQT